MHVGEKEQVAEGPRDGLFLLYILLTENKEAIKHPEFAMRWGGGGGKKHMG